MPISTDSHYQFLGLPNGAPPWQVEVALERLSEQAAKAVYESPQRSHELWTRIRKIREDLLSGEEKREAYDRLIQVREAQTPTEPRAETLATALRDSNGRERRSPRRSLPRSLVVAFLVALLLPVAAALLANSSNGRKKAPSTALLLSNSGKVTRGGFISGQMADLVWNKVAGASKYRVQVAALPSDPSDAVVFRHPTLTKTTAATQYSLYVLGKQIYYWRVQAHVGNAWLPWSRSQHFLVNQPVVGIPRLLIPKDGAVLFNKRLTLCWSSVSASLDYLLSVEGMKTKTITGTCATVPVEVGQYGWKVAAQVHAAATYTGSYSQTSIFKILLRAKPTKHQPVVALRRTKTKSSGKPVTVAVNLPASSRRVSGNSISSGTGRGRVSTRSALEKSRGSHSVSSPRKAVSSPRKGVSRPPKGSGGSHHAVRPGGSKKSRGLPKPPNPPSVPVAPPPSPVPAQPTGVVYVVVVPTQAHQTITRITPSHSSSPVPVTYVNPATPTGPVSSGRPSTVQQPGSGGHPSTRETAGHSGGSCKHDSCSDKKGDHDHDKH